MFTCICIHITPAAKIPAVHRLDSRSAINVVELLKKLVPMGSTKNISVKLIEER